MLIKHRIIRCFNFCSGDIMVKTIGVNKNAVPNFESSTYGALQFFIAIQPVISIIAGILVVLVLFADVSELGLAGLSRGEVMALQNACVVLVGVFITATLGLSMLSNLFRLKIAADTSNRELLHLQAEILKQLKANNPVYASSKFDDCVGASDGIGTKLDNSI